MAQAIVMPSFGMYTAEGTVAAWLKPSGAQVEAGEPVLEIETEKSMLEVMAPASGILHQVVLKGAQTQVESLVGYILAPGESAPLEPSATVTDRTEGAQAQGPAEMPARDEILASPIAKRLAAEHGIDIKTLTGTGPGGRIVEADVKAALPQSEENTSTVEPNT